MLAETDVVCLSDGVGQSIAIPHTLLGWQVPSEPMLADTSVESASDHAQTIGDKITKIKTGAIGVCQDGNVIILGTGGSSDIMDDLDEQETVCSRI